MQRLLLLCLIALATFSTFGCARDEAPLGPRAEDLGRPSSAADIAAHTVIAVPRDLPGIQEAVDAAGPGDKVDIRAGSYVEDVVIDVPGLWIHAQGPVRLEGSFLITADNVTLDGFTIARSGPGAAIAVQGTSGHPLAGISILRNTIDADGGDGVDVDWATSCVFRGNDCSGADQGMDFDHVLHSEIAGNELTGCRWAISLAQFSESHYNVVRNNTCTGNDEGIVLHFASNNEIKLNVCSDNRNTGFDIQKENNDNIIGPHNVANNNGRSGIEFNHVSSAHNTVKQNVALGNGTWDIYNVGTDNTFFNNKAVNVLGVASVLQEVRRGSTR